MRLDQERIFGPITLPILAFDDLTQVIDRINARDKPLALYIFDRDQTRIDRIITQTSSGGVGVNLTLVQFTYQPAVRWHQHLGHRRRPRADRLSRLQHERAVLRNRFLLFPLIFPPTDRKLRGSA